MPRRLRRLSRHVTTEDRNYLVYPIVNRRRWAVRDLATDREAGRHRTVGQALASIPGPIVAITTVPTLAGA